MKRIMYITLMLAITATSYSQANTALSNLSNPTSINQNLLPNGNNTRNLGSSANSWRTLFLDSVMFLKDSLFIHNRGTQNTFVGRLAGNTITTGKNNAAFGYHALYTNKTNSSNTAFGSLALFKNKADNNTAVGYQALYSNTTATLNTAIGYQALYSNTTGSPNTAVGWGALYSNTTGIENTAVGQGALYQNTTGNNNIALGRGALFQNTYGNDNTATGFKSLFSNSQGYYNTANGSQALVSNITGSQTTAIGYKALYSSAFGDQNTAIGCQSLYYNTNGYDNTAVGLFASYNNTTGHYNTALGLNALQSNTIGYENTALGMFADVNNNNLINATALGYYSIVDASNKVRIGNSDVTSIGGQVGWTSFSDGRYKKNIKQDVQGLAFINSLKPITYTVDINGLNEYYDKGRNHDSNFEKVKADMKESVDKASKIIYNGFIAQDVEKVAAKLNYNFSGVDKPQNKDGLYGLRYADFVVPLVKAVQELSKMNNAKDSAIQVQNLKIDNLQNQITELKAMIMSSSQQSTIVSSALLAQNTPNPFNNSTNINYSLPSSSSSAKIIITDKSGKVLKEIIVSGSKGIVKVDASTLASGAYQYSLYIDGRLVDAKQMMLSK